jgi:two-component system sensor histidine kinase ChvG
MQIAGLAGTANLLNREAIPDLTSRHDEIGDLSAALRELTQALAQRIGAIENFAADVAHEIKNPLTSLRSAVETFEKVQDPQVKMKLMAVIRDDVDRLDRLITDIASASRVDAELGRSEAERIDIGQKLATLVDYYAESRRSDKPRAEVVLLPVTEPLIVMGVHVRLVEVLQNLIDNALSFSPPDQQIILSAEHEGKNILIKIEDCGPGIPDNKLEAIFDRFYSERPRSEKFGTHSGLGLSIARQIVSAHRGRIWAENIKNAADANGKPTNKGARFIVQLPAVAD